MNLALRSSTTARNPCSSPKLGRNPRFAFPALVQSRRWPLWEKNDLARNAAQRRTNVFDRREAEVRPGCSKAIRPQGRPRGDGMERIDQAKDTCADRCPFRHA